MDDDMNKKSVKMTDVDYTSVPYEVDLNVPQTVLNNDQMQAVIQWFCTNVITSHPLAEGVPTHWKWIG